MARTIAIAAAGLCAALSACQGGARGGSCGGSYGGGYGGASGWGGPVAPPPAPCARAGGGEPLRAGVIDDNERFEDYLTYVRAYPHRDVDKLDVRDARVISFRSYDGLPASDVPVELFDDCRRIHRARTDAAGRILYAPRAIGGGRLSEIRVDGDRIADTECESVRYDRRPAPPVRHLDVALCLDTTGSMADEIDRLRRTLRDVARRVEAVADGLDVRYALVAYRDHGDEYVVRPFDFTSSVDEADRALAKVRADGGGDYPEAVNEALDTAVLRLSWRPEQAIRLLFLVGDAPPHLDSGTPWTRTARYAIERGIKIVSVGASGLDDTGEFVWRALAQLTLGRFVFLSYGGGTTHHVGEYDENDLDVVLVREVAREVGELRRPMRPAPRQPSRGRDPDDFTTWSQAAR